MSRRMAKWRREAREVVRSLLGEIQAHAGDYHHRTNEEVMQRAEAFLAQLDGGRVRNPRAGPVGTDEPGSQRGEV